VAGADRVDQLPDVPTLQESGVDVQLTNWRGVVAPKGITDEQRDALEDLIMQMVRSDSWADALDREGWTDASAGSDDFAAFVESEQERVDKIVDELGIGKVS
jgi:putative tricarboxylic transport membrane protein